MPLSRRRFLRTGTLTVFVAGCALGSGSLAHGQDLKKQDPSLDYQIPHEATKDAVFYYTRQTFEPYVGGIFVGRGVGGTPVELKLLRVTGYKPGAGTRILTKKARKTNTFSLTFQADGSLSELSTIHTLEHAALGKFDLFMTRTVDKDGNIFYEAVFNQAAE